MTAATFTPAARPQRAWLIAGLLLLAYAVAGNWLVLPGYRRFLAHESSGASGLAFAWGAAKTILWMLSFHLGALLISWAALAAAGAPTKRFRRWFLAGAILWIGLWSIPSLPGPYAAIFAGLGSLILLLIAIVFGRSALTGDALADGRSGHWRIAAAFFFALATWDICGLGSVGGILRPDSATHLANHGLVVTQTTKLIVELAIAWGLMAMAALPATSPSSRG